MTKKNISNTLDISKSQLGKLMATENIRIEHQKVQGPYFNVKDRVLVLPIWKDVDSDLYDLMIGHEVGHALFTPPEGWEAKIKKNGKDFKTFLNLVEDARIEKKMKRKFPGLKKPMYGGYTQLVDRGFFGMKMDEMKYLPFADRVNVHFKLGARAEISFTEEEQAIVDMIDSAETWDEVVHAAEELYKVAKEEKNEISDMLNELMEQMDGFGDNSQGGDIVEDGQSETTQSGGSSGSVNKNFENLPEKMKEMLADWAQQRDMSSITEDAMQSNEKNLIDPSAFPYLYVKMPEINLKNWIVPSKVVHKLMNQGFSATQRSKADSRMHSFMNTNKRFVDNMVKEFELRRNAKKLAKAKVSKSGELDVKKAWKYQLSEDLFKQTTIVPNGKNHGMLMVIDMSSSMTDNMAGTIEQVICMSMFCRKVGIPFDVYSFIDNGHCDTEMREAGVKVSGRDRNSTKVKGGLFISDYNFRLQQLLHNKMGFTEYNNAVKNLVTLANAFKVDSRRYGYGYSSNPDSYIPGNMGLGGTPLNEAVLVMNEVARKFRETTKVEVLTTIVLTDGDGSRSLNYLKEGVVTGFPYDVSNIVIEDPKTKKTVAFNTLTDITLPLLEMYKKNNDSRVIGYYLMAGGNYKNQIEHMIRKYDRNKFKQDEFEKKYSAEFSAERYFGIEGVKGYDVFYMLPGSDLEIENVSMDTILSKKTTKSSLLTAFKKMQNTKQISRVFVRKFITGIS